VGCGASAKKGVGRRRKRGPATKEGKGVVLGEGSRRSDLKVKLRRRRKKTAEVPKLHVGGGETGTDRELGGAEETSSR